MCKFITHHNFSAFFSNINGKKIKIIGSNKIKKETSKFVKILILFIITTAIDNISLINAISIKAKQLCFKNLYLGLIVIIRSSTQKQDCKIVKNTNAMLILLNIFVLNEIIDRAT